MAIVDTSSSAQPAQRGRPRRADVDGAVLAAAAALIVEVGMTGFSMDVVAQRAGVAKTTIYRRWSSREALVLDVMRAMVERQPVPDTGSVRSDLHAYLGDLVDRIEARRRLDVLPQMIAAAVHDGQLRSSLDEFIKCRQQPLRSILLRAKRRGELAEAFDVDVAVDSVLGALTYRQLLTSEPITPRFAERLLDATLSGHLLG